MAFPACDNVFRRVEVDYLVAGGARVTWELQPHFREPTPYTFQLQVNPGRGEPSSGSDPALWTNTGVSTGGYTAIDPQQNQWGKDLRVVYRVLLTTANGLYISPTAQVLGKLTTRQWLLARAIVRRLDLQVKRQSLDTYPGYLLKRRYCGPVCTCTDDVLGGCNDSSHLPCYGTGILGGYWQAATHTLYNLQPQSRDLQRDGDRGTIDDQMVTGRFLGLPSLEQRDVWIDAHSDRRYIVHRVSNVAEMSQVPILVEAELRLAPFGDVIYQFPCS